jgi:hypothetical protein
MMSFSRKSSGDANARASESNWAVVNAVVVVVAGLEA